MRFLCMNEIKRGMVLARPIYNKLGVLLYDVGTKITKPGLTNIQKFGLIGAYILEPTEPIPKITEADREFERFQSMSVLILQDYIRKRMILKKTDELEQLIDKFVSYFGQKRQKINFLKSVRCPEDYIYKHSVNVAILCSIISAQLKMPRSEQEELIAAALLHEAGKMMIPISLWKKEGNLTKAEQYEVSKREIEGNEQIQYDTSLPRATRTMISQNIRELSGKNSVGARLLFGTQILRVADVYDTMTAESLKGDAESEVMAVRRLLSAKEHFHPVIVGALLSGIHILNEGVCVELTSGECGLVIKENAEDVLRPTVLGLEDNHVYHLEQDEVYAGVQIADVLKKLDKRVLLTPELLEKYLVPHS